MQLWSHVGRRIHHKFCIAFERLNVDAQHWLSVNDGSSRVKLLKQPVVKTRKCHFNRARP